MATMVAPPAKTAAKRRAGPSTSTPRAAAVSPRKGSGSKAKRVSARDAETRRSAVADLKGEARSGRRKPAALLADPRAERVRVLTLLSMMPRCSMRVAFEALLLCQVNGARRCGELSGAERAAIEATLFQIGMGIVLPPTAVPGQSEGIDHELDRMLRGARAQAPSVELVPSEFAAARAGLESDPLLLRMVDRLVDAVRLYAERDDGGARARVVAGQWIRYRNYCAKVESGEYPPPRLRGPAVLE